MRSPTRSVRSSNGLDHRARLRMGSVGRARTRSSAPTGARLAALVRKELIRPHEAIEDTFRFRHMLIRDAAYDRVPKAQRADLHERSPAGSTVATRSSRRSSATTSSRRTPVSSSWGRRPTAAATSPREPAVVSLPQAGARTTVAICPLQQTSSAAPGTSFPTTTRIACPLLPMFGRALTDLGDWEQAKALFLEAIEQERPG